MPNPDPTDMVSLPRALVETLRGLATHHNGRIHNRLTPEQTGTIRVALETKPAEQTQPKLLQTGQLRTPRYTDKGEVIITEAVLAEWIAIERAGEAARIRAEKAEVERDLRANMLITVTTKGEECLAALKTVEAERTEWQARHDILAAGCRGLFDEVRELRASLKESKAERDNAIKSATVMEQKGSEICMDWAIKLDKAEAERERFHSRCDAYALDLNCAQADLRGEKKHRQSAETERDNMQESAHEWRGKYFSAMKDLEATQKRMAVLERALHQISVGDYGEGCSNRQDPGDGVPRTCIERDVEASGDTACFPCQARAALGNEPPAWPNIGDEVDYHSPIGGPVHTVGLIVRAKPWQIHDGQWVTQCSGKAGFVTLSSLTPAADLKEYMIKSPISYGKISDIQKQAREDEASRRTPSTGFGRECSECDGLGVVEDPAHGHHDSLPSPIECSACGGTGNVPSAPTPVEPSNAFLIALPDLEATHCCKICGASWWSGFIFNGDLAFPTWSLRSTSCGPCCDNTAMTNQMETLPGSGVAWCNRPPLGWVCSRPHGHEGPCPAYLIAVKDPNAT